MEEKITAAEIERILMDQRDDRQRDHLMRFFKTGQGQYGEGDMFLGLKVPQTRAVVKQASRRVPPEEIKTLLYSPWHEMRLCGFLLMVEEMKACLPKKSAKKAIDIDEKMHKSRRKEIAEFYLRHARQANNWDLVDLSCEYILGPYIRLSDTPDYGILYKLSESDNLWEQRISIVTTLDFIREGIFTPTLELADRLIGHTHDLIHKAIGWTLREIGKRDKSALTDYLEERYTQLHRTTLRYAIERFSEDERQFWLRRR
ncbi:MAG: DNA alkylation repair protein [Muribaculaceae bacterium]|nr:DNA alkylation repair protein [Muribaculaceae bacterium]